MGPLAMAKAECANMTTPGGCLGIPANCLGAKKTNANPLDHCVLVEPKKRCHYFEKAVLPLVQYYPQYRQAGTKYQRRLPKEAPPPPSMIDLWTCDCGKPMAKGKRMCESCRKANRKKAWIRHNEKRYNSHNDS